MYTSFQRKMILDKLFYTEAFEGYKIEYLIKLSDKDITRINYKEDQLTHTLWFNLHLRVNSYLQHYHQLSPMLDFTSSFDVALYFALNGEVTCKEYVSLIILNSKYLTTEKEFKESVCFPIYLHANSQTNIQIYFKILLKKEKWYLTTINIFWRRYID